MKKVIFILLVCFFTTNTLMAKDIYKGHYNGVNKIVDSIPAEFPGGLKAWTEYLNANLDFNVAVTNSAPEGKYPITFQFVIGKEGGISKIVFENNPGYGIQEEILRVLTKPNIPKWKPASINGQNVSYKHKQSLIFSVY
jgi:protein TonB